MLRHNCVYVAATRQHVGKTSASLGLVSGMQELLGLGSNIGFIKPVGQKSVQVTMGNQRVCVDKDVPLFKETLGCVGQYHEMSPVLIGKGYTRRFLNGEISASQEFSKIKRCFDAITGRSSFTVVEGTGHVGVGSSVGLSNASVAARLRVPMILVLNGGIGSALDEFALNYELCKAQGATVCGVLLNKVRPDKLQDVREYTGRALERLYEVPILGCVPDIEFLSSPALLDFERLGMRLVSGQNHRCAHLDDLETVLTGPAEFQAMLDFNLNAGKPTLYAVHASRQDLIEEFREHAQGLGAGQRANPQTGLLVVGHNAAACRNDWNQFHGAPVLCAHESLEAVSERLRKYTAKLNVSDTERTSAVIRHYAGHIDFSAMLDAVAGRHLRDLAALRLQRRRAVAAAA